MALQMALQMVFMAVVMMAVTMTMAVARIGQKLDKFEGGWTKNGQILPAIMVLPQLDFLCTVTKLPPF